jgi:hypothetical protein
LVEKTLCKLIEDVILARYKVMLSPKNMYTAFLKEDMEWVKWRKERLKFQQVKERLPELEGIF